MKIANFKLSNLYSKKYLFPIFLLVTSCLMLIPLFKPGLAKTDDGTLMVLRASGVHESFMDGHLPVRWIQRLNENYGYPVMNFLYPMPFYLSEVFQIFGFSAQAAVETIFGLSVIGGVIGIYFWLGQIFEKKFAFVGGLAFIFHPYLLHDLYVRGSLGEVVAIGFIPWILFFIEKHIKTQKFIYLLLWASSWALLVLSHNSLALIFTPIIAIYFFIQDKKNVKTKLIKIFGIILLMLLMSVWFWLPAIVDLSFTRANSIQISDINNHFYSFNHIVNLFGFLTLISVLASFWFFKKNIILKFLLILFITILFLQFKFSQPIWQLLNLEKTIQFPFRLFSLSVIFTPYLVSFLLKNLSKLKVKAFSLVYLGIVLVFLIQSGKNLLLVQNEVFPANYFETNFDSTTNQKEFTPINVKNDPDTFAVSPFEIADLKGEYVITDSSQKTGETYIQISLKNEQKITFNTHFFPGWKVLVDDQEVTPQIDDRGRPEILITPPQRRDQSRTVKLVWEEPVHRQLANKVSFLTSFIVIGFIVFLLTNKNFIKTWGILSLIILIWNLFIAILPKVSEITSTFDSQALQQKYLNSQWVNPDSRTPLGDHGLYLWAGWEYVNGVDPTLINSEMPPLGKYLIGSLVHLTYKPGLVGLFFSMTFLISLYGLSYEVIKNKYLAFLPLALLTQELIFRSPIANTMLDTIQLTFLCLGFLFFIKSEKNFKYLIPAAIFFGGVLSTKFYLSGVLVLISIIIFLVVSKRFKHLIFTLMSFSLSVLVHVLSYAQYFLLGHSFREYLGVQKWIFNFYLNSGIDVPFGSYWKLVFFNQWRVWWGPSFGVYYTLTTKEWNLLWPIYGSSLPIYIYLLGKKIYNKAKIPMHYVLVSWLLVYGAFLSLIGGWPHYMLLFIPFSSILLVNLLKDFLPDILEKNKFFIKKLAKIKI